MSHPRVGMQLESTQRAPYSPPSTSHYQPGSAPIDRCRMTRRRSSSDHHPTTYHSFLWFPLPSRLLPQCLLLLTTSTTHSLLSLHDGGWEWTGGVSSFGDGNGTIHTTTVINISCTTDRYHQFVRSTTSVEYLLVNRTLVGCWCVNPSTARPVPGTLVFGENGPRDCTHPTPARGIKGKAAVVGSFGN